MKKHKRDLALALPSQGEACDACVARLLQGLAGRRGIASAHVDRTDADTPRLCLHYDPNIVRLDELEGLIERAGAELRTKYEHLAIPLGGLRHERQAKLVEGVFAKEPGVLHAAVSFGARRLYIELDRNVTSRSVLPAVAKRAGVTIADRALASVEAKGEHGPEGEHGHEHEAKGEHEHEAKGEHGHEHGGPFGERSELVFSLACGVLTGIGWLLSHLSIQGVVATSSFVAAYVLGSWFTLQEVVVALRARRFEIDFLMLLAAVGAAVLGEWFEGALLLFLFTLGHALEGYAMGRARKAIEALAKLAPDTALRLEATGEELEVPVGALRIGDRVVVKPNTRVPADGFVAAGTSVREPGADHRGERPRGQAPGR
jgi:Cd2+/Zn2+-exporting ATPase